MHDFILQCSAWEIASVGLAFFCGIYLLFAGINIFLTQQLLPVLGIGQKLDPRPLVKGQLGHELLWSASSIVIFGVGVIVPWGLLQLGWANLAVEASLAQILLELGALLIWNEIHFYINHRLLHSRWLRQFHTHHHRSIVTTPWSTYSFHPVEAIMLGNVIVFPMLVHDFSIYSLFAVPLFSLLFNSIGHSNYDWNHAGKSVFYRASRRHHLHHACFHGNFGFMFPFMDQLLKTSLPPDAATQQINNWYERHHKGN